MTKNPKDLIGNKKPSLSPIPVVSLLHLGAAMADGERKYGLCNWRENEVLSSVYYNAALRHLMSWWDGEQRADDSGVHHLGHAMACLAIILDAESINKLSDDRPIPGKFSDALRDLKSIVDKKSEN